MPHAFVVTRSGCEALLKREAARVRPDFRPAFSRRGLVTFRVPDGETLESLSRWPLVVGRVWGLSLGPVRGLAALEERALDIAAAQSCPLRLHIFDRDDDDPRSDRRPFEALARELEARLRGRAPPGAFREDPVAERGDRVMDLVVTGPDEGLIGLHLHVGDRFPHPGARPPLSPPDGLPSRAWEKLEEALAWTGLQPHPGDRAVDLGCSPGGATLALLQRGLRVLGVDPTPVDPSLRASASGRFTHLQRPVQAVHPGDLPRDFQWMIVDINEGPDRVLPHIRRLIDGVPLRGLLWTVKATRPEVADRIPEIEATLRGLGFGQVRLGQLSRHHREFLAAAWDRQPATPYRG